MLSHFKELRLPKYGYAEFVRKIIEHPHVMVSCKKEYRNTRVAEFGKLAEQSHITFRDGVFILKPEIEDIAQQINRMGVGFDGITPSYYLLFPLQARGMIGHAQMEVRGAVNVSVVERWDRGHRV